MPYWQAEEMAMNKKSDQKMFWLPFSDQRGGLKKKQATNQPNNNKPPEQVLEKQAGAWVAVCDKITTVQVVLTIIDYVLPTATEKFT